MNYQESRAYVDEVAKYGSVLGLANMTELMKRLGNPQDTLQYVHVAGTNGKGSVITYLYTTLTEAGYRVGRYISPTLYTYRERLEAAGEQITREEFAECVTEVSESIRTMVQDGLAHPTPFEIETAAAFLYFQKKQCELVIMEVGMGGNLDATNIITTTKLAVLTSISLDHQAFLGNTVVEIAEKKSGILKPGCEAVSTVQKPEVLEVLEKQASSLKIPFFLADHREAKSLSESLTGQIFSWKGETYQISLAGVCQIENAVLALQSLECLHHLGFPTTLQQRKEGLKKTVWNGRFTVIHEKPYIIVDGAHNPGAAEKLAQSIEHYLHGKRIFYIMGVFRDKDYDTVIRTTYSYAEKIWTIETPGNARALPAKELAEAVRNYHPDVTAADSIEDALTDALANAGPEDVILTFGSLSFIGVLTAVVKEMEIENG